MNTRKFWDPETSTERILTIADIQAQDWESMSTEELLRKLPAGMDMRTIFDILVGHLSFLSKRVKDLEDQVIDKMLLEGNNELKNKD